jgi:hypothetical protein
MKKILWIAVAALVIVACKKEEEDKPVVTNNELAYVDQNLQGEIDGENWAFASGTFSEVSYNDTIFTLKLFPVDDTNKCSSFFFPEVDNILFSCPKVAGKYNLNVDLTGNTESRTVTLYDHSESNNIIASEGWFELMNIDTIKGTMDIKLVAKYDDENMVNGRATLTYCK